MKIKELTELLQGDPVCVDRGLYVHHGIYMGQNAKGQHVVAHYNDPNKNKLRATVRCEGLNEFVAGGKLQLNAPLRAKIKNRDAVVERARQRMGENLYSLFSNNCEHFANWCITGKSKSDQAEALRTAIGVGVFFGVILLAARSA